MRKFGWQIGVPFILLIICTVVSLDFFVAIEPIHIVVKVLLVLGIFIAWYLLDILYTRISDKPGVARKESAASFLHDLFDVSVYDSSLNIRCVAYLITAIANSFIFIIIDLSLSINNQPILVALDFVLSVSIFYIAEYFKGEK